MAYNTWMGKVTIRIYLEYSMLCNFHKRKCAIIYTAHFVTNDVQLTKSKAPTIASHCRQHTTTSPDSCAIHSWIVYTHTIATQYALQDTKRHRKYRSSPALKSQFKFLTSNNVRHFACCSYAYHFNNNNHNHCYRKCPLSLY